MSAQDTNTGLNLNEVPAANGPNRDQVIQEGAAHSYSSRLRSGRLDLRHSPPPCVGDGSDDEEDEGIEEHDIEELMAGNEQYSQQGHPDQIMRVPGRDLILVPEWGDELTARYIQEQRNALAQLEAVNGVPPTSLNAEPPTGPEGYIMIPAHLGQVLAIHDAMKDSQLAAHHHEYPEPAFEMDIQQFILTLACPWIDRNLHLLSERPGLSRRITQPVALGSHFLVALMRPDIKTKWLPRRPRPTSTTHGDEPSSDSEEDWTTLDSPTPAHTPRPAVVDALGPVVLPGPDLQNVLPCEVSSDVDSVIILSDRLPLCTSLEVPSIPSRNDTQRYSNKICMLAGSGRTRTQLSRIPNFRLGRAGRLTVNVFFPEAYDPHFKGMGSSQIDTDTLLIIWDRVIQPAILSVFPDGAYNSMPQSGQYEADRQGEIGGAARPSWRTTTLPSDKVAEFVQAMRERLERLEEPELAQFKVSKFLLSLQGFKSFSFTRFDDLAQSEYGWFAGLGFTDNEVAPLMLFKGYLKGLRRVTKDLLIPDWLDFNDILQQGIARARRLATWENREEDVAVNEASSLDGDELDGLLHGHRRREGPSLQIKPGMKALCNGLGCDTCSIWVDVAAELGCPGKVTVWNHSHCFDVVNSLVGRDNFNQASEWRTGARMDEIATIPGLGGVGFTDKRSPSHGPNSPTPYIQLYCQEKVPTYAAFGSKARGSDNLDQIPARKLPMKYLLDCSSDANSPLERWIRTEKRILEDATDKADRSFPARLEVRTSLENLMETIYNMIVALSRSTESDAFRHYSNNEWFRWKSLRAEHAARLPGTIFGRREARPSDWTIVHALLASQAFVHGLHSRISTVTIERDTVNMHSMYIRVDTTAHGTIYNFPNSTVTLQERARSAVFLPFYPAGTRTLHQYYSAVTGLDYSQFERNFGGMSNAEEKWRLKVRRGVQRLASFGLARLRELIKYRPAGQVARPNSNASVQSTVDDRPSAVIQDDAVHIRLEAIVKEKLDSVLDESLVVRGQAGRDLAKYLEEHEILDVPFIIQEFGRSLGLLMHVYEADRLESLRDMQPAHGRHLIIDANGIVQVETEPLWSVPRASDQIDRRANRLNAGGLDVTDFQRNLPATLPTTTYAVRSFKIEWVVTYTAGSGMYLPDVSMGKVLRDTHIPPPTTEDDREDDKALLDWLRRVQDSETPFPEDLFSRPSIADVVVFILSSFQHQLLMTMPKTVRANKKFPDQEGEPYIKAATERDLVVSQHLMRETYSGLPGRLTRFVATQYTKTKWEGFAAFFFPASLEDCEMHPGWIEPQATYLDLWRGLLERVSELPNSRTITDALVQVSTTFVRSFKVLPDLSGKAYKALRHKKACDNPLSLWDDTAFEKYTTGDITKFDPRWMTIAPGARVASRIRLAYCFTAPDQISYMGYWRGDMDIKEARNNYATLYPSPPPFEYPWMKENYDRVIPEREYMIRKEGLDPNHFNPADKRRGLGHNWWDANHSVVSCAVCRTWSILNPPDLQSETVDPALDLAKYKTGGQCWGYFACSSDDNSSKSVSKVSQSTGRKRKMPQTSTVPGKKPTARSYYN
ncbi:hypothetical protein QFC21_006403 [Naganishia friedmannii]|uniref:Uncharacterized protein n=1 Tax=Naganishia friedmannii TaxID=89922 RepID=A0ACC2V2Q9_9TREE|nr:hypothetical protein QFC21_006403 [Naganishia friedmannii]